MSLLNFIKDKFLYIIIQVSVLLFMIILLSVLDVDSYAISFLSGLYAVSIFSCLTIEFFQKIRFYKNIEDFLDVLDQKYLLSEMLEKPCFYEGKFLFECLQITNKSMNDEIAKYKLSSKEYREYIEMWIHQVKTPIASTRLIIENNKSALTESISEEIDVIEYYLEQALFYSRSNAVEKDYIIKEVLLKDIVNSVVRKNAKAFIRNNIKLSIENIDTYVFTDEKWITFIINQIIINSIQYKKENPSIRITTQEYENNTTLLISDNGIGISEKSLGRIFEKGYTGETGRNYAKSTGIGLYLCKKLCDKLGLAISVTSTPQIETIVKIVFPKSNMMNVLK